MTFERLLREIKTIKKTYPKNLMARYFDENYFNGLDEALRHKIVKIIASGVQNPDSEMGMYAMDASDYDLFTPLFDPMIRHFHEIPDHKNDYSKQSWSTNGVSFDLSQIDTRLKNNSMRVRVARNISTLPLPGAMKKEQRIAFENSVAEACFDLAGQAEFGGAYYSLTPNSPYQMNEAEYQARVNAHQMFKDMSKDTYLKSSGISGHWPYGRGMYISQEEDFLIWVGEEDHLRIMAMRTGSNLNDLFERLRVGLEYLKKQLPEFSVSKCYGNIASCPTNLGTGMRASLHLKMPILTSNGQDIQRLKEYAKPLGLMVRGVAGEHSNAGRDGMVDVSPLARLGVTEVEIMQKLYEGVAKLWALETAGEL